MEEHDIGGIPFGIRRSCCRLHIPDAPAGQTLTLLYRPSGRRVGGQGQDRCRRARRGYRAPRKPALHGGFDPVPFLHKGRQPRRRCRGRGANETPGRRRHRLAHRGRDGSVSRRYRRPDKARTRRLLVRYHKHGDQRAREQAIQEQLPLVEFLARKFAGRGEPVEDLMQVASVGLIKAVDRFDVDRNIEFSTYATPNILGEIKRYFRDKGWAMRVPRGLQELRQSAKEAIRDETVKSGRSPTIGELAEALSSDVESVAEALTLGRAYNTASLDAPASQEDRGGDTILDLQADEESPIDGLEDKVLLQRAMEHLKEQQRRILDLRYNEGKTQTEIADIIGVSQMHVSRLLRRALDDLRYQLTEMGETSAEANGKTNAAARNGSPG